MTVRHVRARQLAHLTPVLSSWGTNGLDFDDSGRASWSTLGLSGLGATVSFR
jgi:hypothetical protein